MDEVINECSCPERAIDLASYGIHICKDGKRIAPEDYFVERPETTLDRIKDQSHGN